MGVQFDELPTEIIHSVLTYVLDSSPHTAKAISRVNKCLLEAANAIRNRRRTITLDKRGKINGLTKFALSQFDNTHHLTIEASKDSRASFSDTDAFVQLMRTIKNLKTLTWNVGPIPVEVLTELRHSHSTCTLRIFKWWRLNHFLNRLDQSETALSKFENLTHLRYVASNDGFGSVAHVLYAWEAFREIVAKSQNLKLASFLLAATAKGEYDWESTLQDSTRESSSDFEGHSAQKTPLKSLTIDSPGFQLSSATLQQISVFTDLSALQYLKISRGHTQLDYYQVAAKLLPNLEHISINLSGIEDDPILSAAQQYLLSCSPAKTLSLWGWSSVVGLSELLAHHGQSLVTLQLHEKENPWDSFVHQAMGAEDINLIKELCPHLIDITLDCSLKVDTNPPIRSFQMWPPIVEALKSLVDKRPQLRRIQVYHLSCELFKMLQGLASGRGSARVLPGGAPEDDLAGIGEDTEEHDEDTGIESTINELADAEKELTLTRKKNVIPVVEPYVTGLWKSLYENSTTGERYLAVKFGEWEQRSSVRVGFYEEGRAFCEVRPHERDDRPGECVVKTRLWSISDPKGV